MRKGCNMWNRGMKACISLMLALWLSTAARVSAEDGTAIPKDGLGEALSAVVTLNPAIKGKRAEMTAVEHSISSAKAGRFPSLSLHANNLDKDRDQGTLRLQQPLWAFGKIDAAIDQAEAGFTAERYETLKIQRQLIENTAAAYARVEGVRKRINVARANIKEHKTLYQRIQRRHAGHLASEADERLAHSRLIQAHAQHLQIKGELQVALTELRALTQKEISAGIPVDPKLANLPPLPRVETLALENNASVKFRRKQLKVARLAIKKEKVAPLPTLYFRVEHEFLDTLEETDETRTGFVIEGNVEGLGLAALGRVRSASARMDASREDINVAINDIRSRTRVLMQNRTVQKALAEAHQQAVDGVRATLSSFLRQYESGRKTWLDVLNTQRELTELRLQFAQANNEWLILSLRISALTGGLDQLAGIKSL